jgi:hypothetical protein
MVDSGTFHLFSSDFQWVGSMFIEVTDTICDGIKRSQVLLPIDAMHYLLIYVLQ